ncbi:unnamed protein product [marine sediment metagenome]|uniref:Uncharacterized protein n=1 Tax=marine sediment metagenome TaxID=412755 RepID=X1G2A9_9ZZZZ
MSEVNFMKVRLINYTKDPEKIVAQSARLCYSALGIEELRGKLSDESTIKLIKKIIKLGHYSVLEHATFTFAIEGISRVTSHQLVRHRLASFSQQSQRYVKINKEGFPYIVPKSIAKDKKLAKIFVDAITELDQGLPQDNSPSGQGPKMQGGPAFSNMVGAIFLTSFNILIASSLISHWALLQHRNLKICSNSRAFAVIIILVVTACGKMYLASSASIL